MDKTTIKLVGPEQRQRAQSLILRAPADYVVTIAPPTRTLDQNAMLWPLLADISRAEPMGRKHTPDDWKAIFMSACGWECQFQEGLDGRPFPMGFRSSQMTKAQFANLIEFILAFAADHNISLSDPQERRAA